MKEGFLVHANGNAMRFLVPVLFAAAALVVGCGPSSVGPGVSPQVMVNGKNAATLAFTAVGSGAPLTMTVTQGTATAGTVFTATPSSGCTSVANVVGSASATTANGPSGTFTVTALSVQPAGTCTISVSSSAGGSAATVTVDTSGVPTVSPTGITIH